MHIILLNYQRKTTWWYLFPLALVFNYPCPTLLLDVIVSQPRVLGKQENVTMVQMDRWEWASRQVTTPTKETRHGRKSGVESGLICVLRCCTGPACLLLIRHKHINIHSRCNDIHICVSGVSILHRQETYKNCTPSKVIKLLFNKMAYALEFSQVYHYSVQLSEATALLFFPG